MTLAGKIATLAEGRHERPQPLQREGIVARALDLADREGVAAVTIRRLARELGVTPMSLYRHVRNKDDLLDAMLERMLGALALPSTALESPLGDLRALLYALRDLLMAHPAGGPLISRRFMPAGNALRALEHALDILRRAGFDPEQAYLVFEQMLQQTVVLVAAEQEALADGPLQRAENEAKWRIFLAALPPGEYPRIVEAAPSIAACRDRETHFRFGVDLLLAGIAAMSPKARTSAGV